MAHSDATVKPDNKAEPLATRSRRVSQYGARPDNYEITYIMHNQQPWALRSDKPCLVTYNPISHIDDSKIIKRWWFQHIVHDLRHVTLLVPLFALTIGGRLVNCGNASGDTATIGSLGHLSHNGLRIMGSDPYQPDEMGPLWDTFCEGVGSGRFTAVIDSEFPLSELAAAQQKMLESNFFGKILLRP